MSDAEEARPLGEEIVDYWNAAYPGLWVRSFEHEEAEKEMLRAAIGAVKDYERYFYVWDGATGMKEYTLGSEGPPKKKPGWQSIDGTLGFENAFAWLASMLSNVVPVSERPAPPPGKTIDPTEVVRGSCVVVMKNLDTFLINPIRDQMLLNHLHLAETKLSQRIVLLSPNALPPKLSKSFQMLTHALPGREKLKDILYDNANEGDLPEDDVEIEAIIDASRGLTRSQAYNAFTLCTVRDKVVSARKVFEEKASAFESTGLGLELNRDKLTFEDVGGLEYLKRFYLEMLAKRFNPDIKRNGIILAGVPGTGKSLFSETAGNSTKPVRPALRWMAAMAISKYVGDSGHNMKEVLDIADSCAPIILEIDEAEKAFADFVGGGESGGSSVGAQMMSIWLPWHQMHRSDVYPILTMNDIIPLAKSRPEFLARFDEVFFIDAPAREQKDAIWKLHMMRTRLIDHVDEYDDMANNLGGIPDDEGWVGRDIWKVCNQSALRGIPLDQIRIGTMSNQAKESLAEMREFAHGRWMSSEYEDYYDKDKHLQKITEVTGPKKRDIARPKKKRRQPA